MGIFAIPKLGLVPGLAGGCAALCALMLLAHLFLAVSTAGKNLQARALEKKWQKIGPDRQALELFKAKNAFLFSDGKGELSSRLISGKGNWSKKLNKLSLILPSGVWFTELALGEKDLTVKGSVISFTKEEMNLIDKYLNDLKSDPEFIKDFNDISLASANRREISGYEIIDFVLTANLKSK